MHLCLSEAHHTDGSFAVLEAAYDAPAVEEVEELASVDLEEAHPDAEFLVPRPPAPEKHGRAGTPKPP